MNKNKFLISSLLTLAPILFVGCTGGSNNSNLSLNNDKKNISITNNGETIAYAYMKEGKTLDYISKDYIKTDNKSYEIIQIKTNGFYPNYDFNDRTEVCGVFDNPLIEAKYSNQDEIDFFCNSHYTSILTAATFSGNLVKTLGTGGLYALTGNTSTVKEFSKESFLEVIQNNNLENFSAAIREIYNLEKKHNSELNKIFSAEKKEYLEDAHNIKFNYNFTDKSGLLFGKELKPNFIIKPEFAEAKTVNYTKKLKFKTIEEINQYKKELENDFITIKTNYEGIDSKKLYTNYLVQRDKNNTISLNKNISYDVSYKYNEKIKRNSNRSVNVEVIVEKANLNDVLPTKKYFIRDGDISFEFSNKNGNYIDIIASNHTNKFTTIKSITSYLNNNRFGLNDMNIEISPNSKTLPNNSSYPLISDEMLKDINKKGVTYSDIKNKKFEYGYAIKYNMQNSNQSKTIYETKTYNLIDIFKENI